MWGALGGSNVNQHMNGVDVTVSSEPCGQTATRLADIAIQHTV